jgi:hypothetical protein
MNRKNNLPPMRTPGRWLQTWLCGAALAMGTLASADDGILRIAGSEWLGESVVKTLQLRGEETGEVVKATFRGSRLGRDQLEAGVMDMAVLIDDPAAEAMPEEWLALPLAHVSTRVVVRRDLDIEQLNYADLALIFSAGSAVATPRWGDFGASDRWASVPVSAHVVTAAGGMGHEIFVHMALPTPDLKNSVRRHEALDRALEAVLEDEGGIAVVPWLPETETGLKELLIAPTLEEVAFGPSAENLVAGDYPLTLALRLVVPRARVAELLPWLQFWYGEEIEAALVQEQLSPLPRTVRNQQIFDLEAAASRE